MKFVFLSGDVRRVPSQSVKLQSEQRHMQRVSSEWAVWPMRWDERKRKAFFRNSAHSGGCAWCVSYTQQLAATILKRFKKRKSKESERKLLMGRRARAFKLTFAIRRQCWRCCCWWCWWWHTWVRISREPFNCRGEEWRCLLQLNDVHFSRRHRERLRRSENTYHN